MLVAFLMLLSSKKDMEKNMEKVRLEVVEGQLQESLPLIPANDQQCFEVWSSWFWGWEISCCCGLDVGSKLQGLGRSLGFGVFKENCSLGA